jgi:hypothetical protein
MSNPTSVQNTSASQRPGAAVIAVIVAVATGVMMAWSQRGEIVGRGTTRDHAAALCLLIAGISGIAGGIGAWKRAPWATGVLAAWIAGTLIAIPLQDVVDAGTLIPILVFCGPQVLITWYLFTWIRGGDTTPAPAVTRDPIGTPVLIAAAVFGPPIITVAGFTLIAALPGNPASAALLLMPVALLAFVVVLWRRASSRNVAVAFTTIAVATSAIAMLVMTLGSMVK